MTLMGKIFRPWDLPAEDSAVPSPIGLGESERKSRVSSSAQSERVENRRENRESRRSTQLQPVQYPSHEMLMMMGAYDEAGVLSPVTPSCCDPNSPADFDLQLTPGCGNGSPSNIFLYPNAINELANLSRNELTAMGLLPPGPPSSHRVKRQRPKRFHCPHCQVAFSNNGQLRGHIRIHTGERPFVCEDEGCGKSFTRNEELTRHRRIHSGMRPFPCSYCGKKFGRKDHLKKHTRTHQRGLYNSGGLMIGYSNPFQPFHASSMQAFSASSAAPSNPQLLFQQSVSALPHLLLPQPHPHYHPFSS